MPDQSIVIAASLPPTPLILANDLFVSEITSVEARVSALKISDAATAQEAANMLVKLTSAGRALENARIALKQPFLNVGRKIDEVAQGVSSRIVRTKDHLSRSLSNYQESERQRLAEIERQRQAEIARLEAEKRRQEEEEAERIRMLAAATPPADALDFSFEDVPAPKTEIETKIEALKYAPALVATKPVGVAFQQTLKFRVLEVHKLPEQFKIIVANEQELRATYCVGWKEGQPMPAVPGVAFFVENSTKSTGRATQ